MAFKGIPKLRLPHGSQLEPICEWIFHSADFGVVVFGAKSMLIEYNATASVLFSLTPEMKGKYTLAAFFADQLQIDGSPEQLTDDMEITLRQYQYRVSDKSVYDDNQKLTARFFTFTDITKLHGRLEQLKDAAHRDYLTGLLNRYAYYKELHDRVQRGEPITVVRCSVEGIALINELFGNEYGDGVIQAIGQTLQCVCTGNDVCARIDGVDFAFILSRSEREARKLFESDAMRCTRVRDGAHEIAVNLVFGVVSKKNDGVPVENLLKTALEDVKTHRLRNEVISQTDTMQNLRDILVHRKFYDQTHEAELQRYLTDLGRTCNISERELEELLLLATMHNIGLISVPPDVLKRRGALNESEWDMIKLHVVRGSYIAKSVPELAPIADEILHHHERWDGLGYPSQLSGEDIPLNCRILDIVRYYVSNLHASGEKPGIPSAELLAKMEDMSGLRFDPKLFIEFKWIVDIAENPLDFAVSELR